MFTHFAKAVALLSSATWLLSGYPALAGHVSSGLTPARAQEFSRDLVRVDSQDFFRIGHERFEQEIQLFSQKRFTSKKPLLKIQQLPQVEGPSFNRSAPPE